METIKGIDAEKMENILRHLIEAAHKFLGEIKNVLKPLLKFVKEHADEVNNIIDKINKKNKYLKRVKNRQRLYLKRKASGNFRTAAGNRNG